VGIAVLCKLKYGKTRSLALFLVLLLRLCAESRTQVQLVYVTADGRELNILMKITSREHCFTVCRPASCLQQYCQLGSKGRYKFQQCLFDVRVYCAGGTAASSTPVIIVFL